MSNERFIPTEEIARLSKGSFEAQISTLGGVVTENKKALFGESVGEVKIVATFPGRCVVLSEGGQFVSVRYEPGANGSPRIVGHEKLTIPVVEGADATAYIRKEALKAVDAFMNGDVKGASELTHSVLQLSQRVGHGLNESKVLGMVEIEMKSGRPWQKIYKERLVRIRSTVSDKIGLVESAKLDPKFARLYSGKEPADKLEGFRDLVQEDLRYLKDRVTALGDLVEASLESAKPVLASKDLSKEEAALTFRSFAEDLLHDVRRVAQIVNEGSKRFSKVESLGKLYDSIVMYLYPREVAGQFVREMSERLIAAGGQ